MSNVEKNIYSVSTNSKTYVLPKTSDINSFAPLALAGGVAVLAFAGLLTAYRKIN